MAQTDAVARTISSISTLSGQLPRRIEKYRTTSSKSSSSLGSSPAKGLARVYQYTRLQTLLDSTHPWEWTDKSGSTSKMFGQRSIWATSAPYMNDRREYEHGCEVMRDAINRRRSNNVRNEAVVLDMLTGLLSEPLGRRFYVASFSEKSDDLGQWRGYGDWGQGICLGYNYLALEKSRSWFSGWVVYEPLLQAKVSDMIVQDIISRVVPNITLDPPLEGQIINAATRLLRVILPAAILLMKDPAFRDEAEYRLIQAEDAPSPPQIKYRLRGSRLVPYIEMAFSDSKTLNPVPAPLEEVVLGPASNDHLNIAAVKGLLSSRGLYEITVTPSPIPFLP